ncbi:MAG TPA: dihydrofolate reductase family protein [Solirubrobacteraceae bacterium]|jgi:5-amino-6-(5-phosphoribosylamino)uracil reductase
MLFEQLIPPGVPEVPEQLFANLELGAQAPRDRPYVVCNFVASLDGKATVGGRTSPLSDPSDRAAFHLLRSQVDAVSVGTGTLRVERYGPLVRQEQIAGIREAAGMSPRPLAVVISRTGAIPYDIPLFRDPDSEVALYLPVSAPEPPDCEARLHVHRLEGGGADLSSVLLSLREHHDVRSLLCEGGPLLFNSLIAADLVDELFLTLAPTLVGGGEHAVTEGPSVPLSLGLQLIRALVHDSQLFLRYARN